MAYPTTIDSIPDPTPTNRRNAPSLANGQVAQNTAIEATQTYLGVSGAPADSNTITGRVKVLEAATPNSDPRAVLVGYQAWNLTPGELTAGGTTAATNGTLKVLRMPITPGRSVQRVHIAVASGSAVANAFAAFYTNAGVLVAQSDNQGANISPGIKTFNFVSPYVVPGEYLTVAFWITGTPTLSTAAWATPNVNYVRSGFPLVSASTNNTGLTTVAPATLGTETWVPAVVWCAVS